MPTLHISFVQDWPNWTALPLLPNGTQCLVVSPLFPLPCASTTSHPYSYTLGHSPREGAPQQAAPPGMAAMGKPLMQRSQDVDPPSYTDKLHTCMQTQELLEKGVLGSGHRCLSLPASVVPRLRIRLRRPSNATTAPPPLPVIPVPSLRLRPTCRCTSVAQIEARAAPSLSYSPQPLPAVVAAAAYRGLGTA